MMDSEIDHIWDTKERIRKRSDILEKKLEKARRVLHLPGSEYYPLDGVSSGEDTKTPFHLRTNAFRYTNMSNAQIRFAHDADRKNVKSKLAREDACAQQVDEEDTSLVNVKIRDDESNFLTIKENLASLDLRNLESKLEAYKVKAGAICKQIAQRCSGSTSAVAKKSGILRAETPQNNDSSSVGTLATRREIDGHSSSGSIDKKSFVKKPRLYYNGKNDLQSAVGRGSSTIPKESNDVRVRRIRTVGESADESSPITSPHPSNRDHFSSVSQKSKSMKDTYSSKTGHANVEPTVEENPPRVILKRRPRMRHHLIKCETRKESSSSDEKECKLRSRQRDGEDLANFIHRRRLERRDKSTKKDDQSEKNIEKVRYYDQNLVKKLIVQRKLYLSKEKLLAKKLKEQEKMILQENIRSILNEQRERRRQPFVELYLNAKRAHINVCDAGNSMTSTEHFVDDLKKRFVSEDRNVERQQQPVQNLENGIEKPHSRGSSDHGMKEKAGHVSIPRLDLTSLLADSPPSIISNFDHFRLPEQVIDKSREAASPTTSTSDSNIRGPISFCQQVVSNKSSPRTPNPPPSVSSLSLITPPEKHSINVNYIRRFSCENMPHAVLVNDSSSFGGQDFTPKKLQFQVNAGLNYLNFIQNSIDHVKDIEVTAVSAENATSLNEQQIKYKNAENRNNLVVNELNLLSQMNETQKLLYETIRTTNERLENNHHFLSPENIAEISTKTAKAIASTLMKVKTPGVTTTSKRAQSSCSSSSTETLTTSSKQHRKKHKKEPSKLLTKIPVASVVVSSEKTSKVAKKSDDFATGATQSKESYSSNKFQKSVVINPSNVERQPGYGSSLENEDPSSSFSITDRTERESKLRALRSSLKEKKQLADKLKQEYKRRTNEKFRLTEESLKKQVQIYDEHIKEIKTQIDAIEKAPRSSSSASKLLSSPRIMSPRVVSVPSFTLTSHKSKTERSLTPRSLFSEKSQSESPTSGSRKCSDEQAKNQSDKLKSSPPKNSRSSVSAENILSKARMDSIGKSSSISQKIFGENNERPIEIVEIDTTDEVSDVPEEETISEGRSTSEHLSKTLSIEPYHKDLPIKLNGSVMRTSEQSPSPKDQIQINRIELNEDNSLDPCFFRKNEATLERLADKLFTSFLLDELRSVLKFFGNEHMKISHHKKDRCDKLCNDIFEDCLSENFKNCLKVVDSSSFKRPLERSFSPSASPRSPSVSKYVSEIYRLPDNDHSLVSLKSPRSLILPKLDLDQDELTVDSTLRLENDDFLVDSLEDCSAAKSVITSKPLSGLTLRQTGPLALTTDVFAAIPHGRSQYETLINAVLHQLYKDRRCGESISKAIAPQSYYSIPLENTSLPIEANRSSQKFFVLNSDADIAFRDFIFDYCKETLTQIFSDDIANRDCISSIYRLCLDGFEIGIDGNDFLKFAIMLGKSLKFKTPGQFSKLKYRKHGRDQKNVARVICDNLHEVERGIQNSSVLFRSPDANLRHKSVARKKLDVVDEILLPEMYTEEFSWTDYEFDELCCEILIVEQIWNNLLDEEFDNCFHILSATHEGIVI